MDNRYSKKIKSHQQESGQVFQNNGSSIFNSTQSQFYPEMNSYSTQKQQTTSSSYGSHHNNNNHNNFTYGSKEGNPDYENKYPSSIYDNSSLLVPNKIYNKSNNDALLNQPRRSNNQRSQGESGKLTDMIGDSIRYTIIECKTDFSFEKEYLQKIYFYEVKQSNPLGNMFNLNHAFVLLVLNNNKQYKIDISETAQVENSHEFVDISIREYDGRNEIVYVQQYQPKHKSISMNDVQQIANSFIGIRGDTYILSSNNCYHFANHLLGQISANYDEFSITRLNQLIDAQEKGALDGAMVGYKLFGGNPIGGLIGGLLGGMLSASSSNNNGNRSSFGNNYINSGSGSSSSIIINNNQIQNYPYPQNQSYNYRQ